MVTGSRGALERLPAVHFGCGVGESQRGSGVGRQASIFELVFVGYTELNATLTAPFATLQRPLIPNPIANPIANQ